MNFVTYKTLPFSTLSNDLNILLVADKTIILNSLNVTNITNENIAINVKLTRDSIVDSFIVKNKLLQSNESVNVLDKIELFIENLDKIVCFSNGYSEIFDCTLCYSELNEDLGDII